MYIKPSLLPFLCLVGSISTSFAGNFQIDKTGSTLAAEMHASPSHDFTSVATDYTYDIEINPDTMVVNKATCSFKFADLDSGKSSRDKKMCKWIDIESYPTASFEMKTQLPDNTAGEHVAEGSFKMHGMERPITIAYTVERDGEKVILNGHAELNHENWGLKAVRLLFFAVDPLLKPEFHLVGSLQP